jgi:plastocyanin
MWVRRVLPVALVLIQCSLAKEVQISWGFDLSEASVSIDLGDTVIWFLDQDGAPHSITSGIPGNAGSGDVFDSGILQPGASFSHLFSTTGPFDYFCSVHPSMVGKISGKCILQT